MNFLTTTTLLRILFLAVAARAATTTSASASQPTTLTGLVSEIPSCAAGCLETIHEEIGCDPANLTCLCSDVGSLVAKMGPCLIKNECDLEEISNSTDLIQPICDKMNNNPSSAEVSSASEILDAAIATHSATASTHSSTATNAAVGLGCHLLEALVVGGVAALAI